MENYEQSRTYNKYMKRNAWCITYDNGMFKRYIQGEAATAPEVWYFLLREPDWNTIPYPENKKESQYDRFDDYATSMIAVTIRKNGMVDRAVSRYNHGLSSGDYTYNDEELSNLIGRPIYDVCKPLNPINAPSREDKSKIVIKNGLAVFKSAKGDSSIIQYQGNYYLNMGGIILKDRKSNRLFKFENIRKIKEPGKDQVKGYLFYYSIEMSEKLTKKYILGYDSNLKMVISSREITDQSIELKTAKELLSKILSQEKDNEN